MKRAQGTLEVLGSRQATARDDYRDVEPGKIMHELRLGELAKLELVPHTPPRGRDDAGVDDLAEIALAQAEQCRAVDLRVTAT